MSIGNKSHRYTIKELKKMAEELAQNAVPPFVVMLDGDVGAGKTTFSQFFITPLLVDKNIKVTSPTFNIIHTYDTTKGIIYHADLYRLKDEEELLELGIIEAMSENICIIEWPNTIKKFINNTHKVITLKL